MMENIKTYYYSYGEKENKEILVLRILYLEHCYQNPAINSIQSKKEEKLNFPIHFQYDEIKNTPKLFSDGFRPEKNFEIWFPFIKQNNEFI